MAAAERESTASDGAVALPEPPLGPIPAGPVALVNDVPIARERFLEIYDLKRRSYAAANKSFTEELDRRHRKRVLQRLVYAELVRQEAAKSGLEAPVGKLDALEAERRRAVADWDAALIRRGESEATNRELDRTTVLVEQILDRAGALAIGDAEIEAQYEQRKVRYHDPQPRRRLAQIVVRLKPPEAATRQGNTDAEYRRLESEARAKIDHVATLARQSGADFAKLAREHSEAGNAEHGGRMGILNRSTLGEARAQAVWDQPSGKVAGPVRTEVGFELLVAYETYPPGTLPLSAVEEQLRSRAARDRKLSAGREFNQRLYREAKLEYRLMPDPGSGFE